MPTFATDKDINLIATTMRYNFSLSSKAGEGNRFEVYIKANAKVGDKVVTMRAKSGIYVDEAFFVDKAMFPIDRKDKARIITPEIMYHREMATRLQSLLDFIDEKVQEVNNHRKDKKFIVPYTKDWLKDIVREFLHIKSARNDSETDFMFHAFYSREVKPFSAPHIAHIKTLTRDIHRYVAFVRKTENHAFTFDPSSVDKETIENFFSYLRNEVALLNEDCETPNTIIRAKDIKACVMAANKDCDGILADRIGERG